MDTPDTDSIRSPFATTREFDKLEAKVDTLSHDLTAWKATSEIRAQESNRKLDFLIDREKKREDRETEQAGAVKYGIKLWSIVSSGSLFGALVTAYTIAKQMGWVH
ncbi:hypothetical protein J2D73_12535 [Acetobacter sacchari]|uniref:Uncharacterized protein n=1 Tax=Acetobacter sacchari TaxID=2661687 RepID=A0ABS3LXG3_9PROT|nr:hypothetical protein [Acetobacter sacchari]MBO1360615.1 hypothetical protein [Acetobacter sacchari]